MTKRHSYSQNRRTPLPARELTEEQYAELDQWYADLDAQTREDAARKLSEGTVREVISQTAKGLYGPLKR